VGLARRVAVLFLWLAAVPAIAAPPLAIVDVDVVPMDAADRLLHHRTVLVVGEKIARVGPVAAVYVPEDAVVVRGHGLTVLPGLADMHAHLPGPEGIAMPVDDYLFLQVARGVTTLRSMRGSPEQIALRERVRKGDLLGPDLVLGSQAVHGDAPLTPAAARAAVAAARRQKVEFIKLVSVGSAEDYRNLVGAAREEHLRIAGHVPAAVGLDLAIESGQHTIEHIEPLLLLPDTDEAVKRLATQLLAGGVYLCPTLDWYAVQWLRQDDAALARRHGLQYVPAAVRAAWQAEVAGLRSAAAASGDAAKKLRRIEAAAHLIGRLAHFRVAVLAGAGGGAYSVPGFGLLEELRALVAAGLSPYVALRGATADAAAALDNRPFGTVKKGRRADLVLVEGNPMESIEALDKVRGVVLRGRWIPPEEIEAGLARIAEAAKGK
jgi:imidazolonepropionase-like amidohydrolase